MPLFIRDGPTTNVGMRSHEPDLEGIGLNSLARAMAVFISLEIRFKLLLLLGGIGAQKPFSFRRRTPRTYAVRGWCAVCVTVRFRRGGALTPAEELQATLKASLHLSGGGIIDGIAVFRIRVLLLPL